MLDEYHEFLSNKKDIEFLNCVTKYPSIDTFHRLQDGRFPTNDTNHNPASLELLGLKKLDVYEKIDGVNVRVILVPGCQPGITIGSRESILYISESAVYSNNHDIVETIFETPEFETLVNNIQNSPTTGEMIVLYGEVFGGKTNNHKRYHDGNPKVRGFKLFDVAVFNKTIFEELHEKSLNDISLWREKHKMPGVLWFTPENAPKEYGIPESLWAPKHDPLCIDPSFFRCRVWDIKDLLHLNLKWRKSRVLLDNSKEYQLGGTSEGVILRAQNRRDFICKIRFEEYDRILT